MEGEFKQKSIEMEENFEITRESFDVDTSTSKIIPLY